MSPARPDAAPAAKPIEVSPELKSLMRRIKLGQLLDTLPERLALARSNRLPHHDFLEMLLADEVTRGDRQSAARRAKAAHLDPQMQLQAWDDTAAVSFDQQLWAELTSLRFLADAFNVLIMGPVAVGKTFLANVLGHIAVRRRRSAPTISPWSPHGSARFTVVTCWVANWVRTFGRECVRGGLPGHRLATPGVGVDPAGSGSPGPGRRSRRSPRGAAGARFEEGNSSNDPLPARTGRGTADRRRRARAVPLPGRFTK